MLGLPEYNPVVHSSARNIEGVKVNVFITAPGSPRQGPPAKVGPIFQKTETGEGNMHLVVFENFRKTFPSTPPGAAIEDYIIEGSFEQDQGGDSFTTTKSAIKVVP